jgi:DDE domain
MFVSIGGRRMYLWRAVDAEGEVLDILVQAKRDQRAAQRLMRKLLRTVRSACAYPLRGRTLPKPITQAPTLAQEHPTLQPDPQISRAIFGADKSGLVPNTLQKMNSQTPATNPTYVLARLAQKCPIREWLGTPVVLVRAVVCLYASGGAIS